MDKVLICTHADKRPDFIPTQLMTFKKFLKHDFEFVVFNNAVDQFLRSEVKRECENCGVKCVPIDNPDHSTANYACAYAVQWSWDNYIIHQPNKYAVMLDSDMFLVKPFSFIDQLGNHDIGGIGQGRQGQTKVINYLWNGVLVFNMHTLPQKNTLNFYCGNIDGAGLDVGGMLYNYFQAHPEVKIRYIPHTSHISPENGNMHCLPRAIQEIYKSEYKLEMIAEAILHYGAGSNWNLKPEEFHNRKTNLLMFALHGAMEGRIEFPTW